MLKIQAEIEYIKDDGTSIHSDIEPDYCDFRNLKDPDYIIYLHDCLDEWIQKSGGTGTFYIEQEGWKRT